MLHVQEFRDEALELSGLVNLELACPADKRRAEQILPKIEQLETRLVRYLS
jgi:hypothetical protein